MLRGDNNVRVRVYRIKDKQGRVSIPIKMRSSGTDFLQGRGTSFQSLLHSSSNHTSHFIRQMQSQVDAILAQHASQPNNAGEDTPQVCYLYPQTLLWRCASNITKRNSSHIQFTYRLVTFFFFSSSKKGVETFG